MKHSTNAHAQEDGLYMPGTDGIAQNVVKATRKAAAGTIGVDVTHTVSVDVRAARVLLMGFFDALAADDVHMGDLDPKDREQLVDDYLALMANGQ